MAETNIERTSIESWKDLMLTINEFIYWPDYIFRGQAQANWLLESNLSRTLKTVNFADKSSLVDKHLANFKLEIRGRRGNNPRELGKDDLWALGQHYGLHTPLLDWSVSPWVALFFALVGNQEDQGSDRSLWALNKADIPTINQGYIDEGLYLNLIEPTIDENTRLVNQKGLFTKVSYDSDIEKWICNGVDAGHWVSLYKFTFPDSLREKALNFLNQMNINYSSLFPDLYGSSKNSNVLLTQVDYIELSQKRTWAKELSEDEFH